MNQPIPFEKLVRRLRLMAESGGMITRDRRNAIIEAADLLEIQKQTIDMMTSDAECEVTANEIS